MFVASFAWSFPFLWKSTLSSLPSLLFWVKTTLRAHMLEEQEGPSRFEHAPDLAQTALWIPHGTEDERGHSTIEMCIGEREGFDRGVCGRDGDGSSRQAPPDLDEH